ncbi:hypothetical protein [Pseudomonas sp. AM8]|uniref:hypothetical protein n=1 Tax=Pseudomonas sp. AM8 TaxID=2983368 RepID=UPI002E7FDDA6|nr:hypothetical protein [Pseudomonas sp. AM8]
MNKTIHIALSRPGTGKTHNACRVVPQWLATGKQVLFVVPTISLADEVFKKLCALGLTPLKIDSGDGVAAIATLNKSLDPTEANNLIVCQQAAFHQCRTNHLKNWIAIVDELPTPVRPQANKVKSSQLSALQYLDVGLCGRVTIKSGCTKKVEDELRAFNTNSNGAGPTSLLSKDALQIYEAALARQEIFISNEDDSKYSLVYFADEAGFFDRFKHCREVHLLTATWTGSLFEWFANAHGFNYQKSSLTPHKPSKHRKKITIYPMLTSDQCSKSVLNSPYKPENANQVVETGTRNIQVIADLVSEIVDPGRQCLVFVQDWAKLDYKNNLIKCNMDSRGLNLWSHVHDALCMFHGNHVTIATKCLMQLAEKYNQSYESLRNAWTQTYLFDATLQNVYRCSLRDQTSTADVILYVQTYEVAEYLINTYLEGAVIDMKYARTYRKLEAPGPKPEPGKSEAMRLLATGLKPAIVAKRTEISVNTIYNYNKERKQTSMKISSATQN